MSGRTGLYYTTGRGGGGQNKLHLVNRCKLSHNFDCLCSIQLISVAQAPEANCYEHIYCIYTSCVCVYVGRVAGVVKSKGSCDAVSMSFCLRVDCYFGKCQ